MSGERVIGFDRSVFFACRPVVYHDEDAQRAILIERVNLNVIYGAVEGEIAVGGERRQRIRENSRVGNPDMKRPGLVASKDHCGAERTSSSGTAP